jgi:hypothetical protein
MICMVLILDTQNKQGLVEDHHAYLTSLYKNRWCILLFCLFRIRDFDSLFYQQELGRANILKTQTVT